MGWILLPGHFPVCNPSTNKNTMPWAIKALQIIRTPCLKNKKRKEIARRIGGTSERRGDSMTVISFNKKLVLFCFQST